MADLACMRGAALTFGVSDLLRHVAENDALVMRAPAFAVRRFDAAEEIADAETALVRIGVAEVAEIVESDIERACVWLDNLGLVFLG